MNFERSPNVRDVVLAPGGFHFGTGRERLRTLLGSCVSIVAWHPVRHIGGMCHFMLPTRGIGSRQGEPDGRYADEAMLLFASSLRRLKATPSEFEVKLVGGGSMYVSQPGANLDVAARNVEIARRLCREFGFAVSREDLAGTGHRNVVFELWNGNVWVRNGTTTPRIL